MKRMALTMAGFSAQAALEPAAEARVAELEAELAAVLSDVGIRWPHQVIEANHAARQRQKEGE